MLEYLISIWPQLAGGVLLGCAVGCLTGLFGAGGGFIVTPALNILLGVPMNLAVGTSSLQVAGASAFSLREHLDRRLLGIRVALCFGIGIPFGAFLGAKLVGGFKRLEPWRFRGAELNPVDTALLLAFAVLLLLIACWMLYDSFIAKRDDEAPHAGALLKLRIPPMFKFRTIQAGEFSIPVMAALGFAAGFLSGLLGIGGGVILLPALFYLVGQDAKAAAQTSMMLVLLSGLFGSVFHALDGNIDYVLAAALLAGALFGAKLGARLQKRLSGAGIRKGFGFVVLAAWLLVVFKLGRMLLA